MAKKSHSGNGIVPFSCHSLFLHLQWFVLHLQWLCCICNDCAAFAMIVLHLQWLCYHACHAVTELLASRDTFIDFKKAKQSHWHATMSVWTFLLLMSINQQFCNVNKRESFWWITWADAANYAKIFLDILVIFII